MTGLYVQVSVRKGTGPDAVLVNYGVTSLDSAHSLDENCGHALAALRKNLAADQLNTIINKDTA